MNVWRFASSRRGVALLLSLAVLGVLGLMSVAFVRLSQTERSGAANYIHAVHAKLAAEAGVEQVIGQLGDFFRSATHSGPDQPWVTRDNATNSQPDPVVPLDQAANPSFRAGTYAAPSQLAGRGHSGMIRDAAPYRTGASDTWPDAQRELSYAARVVACSSRIDVNAGELGGALTSGYNARLRALLDRLVTEIAADPTIPGSAKDALPSGLGALVLGSRPAAGYPRIQDLEGVLGARPYQQLRPFLTAGSPLQRPFGDPLDPTAPAATSPTGDLTTVRPHPTNSIASYGDDIGAGTPPVSTVRESWTLPIEPRPPIDLNTASRAVLSACLVGLRARYLELYRSQMKSVETPAITPTQARLVADAILLRRASSGGFASWQEWDEFLDVVGGSVSGLDFPASSDTRAAYRARVVDVIRAATNPNTRLNKFNPNDTHRFPIDKSDLLDYSTEFCLLPDGLFTIECEGRVMRNGWLTAAARVEVKVRIYDQIRHTTQRDFELARTGGSGVQSLPVNLHDSPAAVAREDGQLMPEADDPAMHSSTQWSFPAADSHDARSGAPITPLPSWTQTDHFSPLTMLGSGSDSSDRFADGVFLGWRRREHLKFESSTIFPLPKGSLEFWIKFDWGQDLNTSTDCNLLNGFFPIDEDHILQWSFYCRRNSRNDIYSSFQYYPRSRTARIRRTGPWTPLAPGFSVGDIRTGASRMSANIQDLGWQRGQWHHIAIQWDMVSEHDMYVDGVRVTPVQSFPVPTSASFSAYHHANLLRMGCYGVRRRSTIYSFMGATIDGLRVYSTHRFPGDPTINQYPKPGATPRTTFLPQRYPRSDATFSGEMTLPAGTELGTLRATVYQPRSLQRAESQLDLRGSALRPTVDVSHSVSGGSLTYTLTFRRNGLSPYNTTAIVDDVTATVFGPPRVLVWESIR